MGDENLKILQKELLNIFKVFSRKCDENNLAYYLFFGSLIGAIRHQGFIPWDDDIDIAMPREDYDRFIALYKEGLNEEYFLEWYGAQLYQSNSPILRINSRKVSIRRDRNKSENYIPAFIGIYPIDGLPTKPFKRDIHIKRIMFRYGLLRASRASIYGLGSINNRTFKDNILVYINKVIKVGRFLKPRKAAENVDKCMSRYIFKGSKFCHVMDYDRARSFYFTEDFLDRQLVSFEDTNAYVPKGYDRILRDYYGDYMILPPVEERIPRHSIQIKINN